MHCSSSKMAPARTNLLKLTLKESKLMTIKISKIEIKSSKL